MGNAYKVNSELQIINYFLFTSLWIIMWITNTLLDHSKGGLCKIKADLTRELNVLEPASQRFIAKVQECLCYVKEPS